MPAIDTPMTMLALVAAMAYLLGAVPFGVLLAKAFGLGNLREIGSGNIGATNVLRTGNKPAAALTLVLDGAKGAVAVLIARAAIGEDAGQVAGLAAFLGHLYPIYLGFKGGKGVATFLGVMLAVAPIVGLACCATWLLVAFVTRFSSYAALVAAASAPCWGFILVRSEIMILGTILALLIFYRHRANIARIKAGTEPKIGDHKDPTG